MGYRKIIVNEKTYEYSVGKSHVKINGFEAIPKELIGAPVPTCGKCDSCGCDTTVDRIAVRPKEVRKYIEEKLS